MGSENDDQNRDEKLEGESPVGENNNNMKNGLIIWNVVLTLLAGYLLFAQFSAKKKNSSSVIKTTTGDTASTNGQFRIAYFEMDSVAANFQMVKEVKAELNQKEEEINGEIDRLSKNLQQKYTYYQNQAQAGKLSQGESEAASIELKKLDDDMKSRKQQLDQEYNDFMVRRQNDIKTKIEGFLHEYNKERTYSYIVSYEQGLFYYKDTAYNITGDVIKGLNELYKPKKK
ncbi:MAG: OmpH family outer membrane protein [Chitinophagaceae bacterium]